MILLLYNLWSRQSQFYSHYFKVEEQRSCSNQKTTEPIRKHRPFIHWCTHSIISIAYSFISIVYLLCGTFPVAQMVKNPPAMWETWVWSLGRDDPLEEGISSHSSILSWRIPMDRGARQATVHGVTKSDTTEWLSPSIRRDSFLNWYPIYYSFQNE